MQEDLKAHITMNIPIDQRLFFTTTLSLVESLHAAKAKSGLQLRYLVQTIANQLFFFFFFGRNFPSSCCRTWPFLWRNSFCADVSPSFFTPCSLQSLPGARLLEQADVQRHWLKRRQQGTAESMMWLPSLIPVSMTCNMPNEGWEISTESILTPQNTRQCLGRCLRLLLTQNFLPCFLCYPACQKPCAVSWITTQATFMVGMSTLLSADVSIKIFVLMQLHKGNPIVLEIE